MANNMNIKIFYLILCVFINSNIAQEITSAVNSSIDEILPKDSECGADHHNDQMFMNNSPEIDQYPWMALIEYRGRLGKIIISCGAALISKKYVITSAHCVTGAILRTVGTPIKIQLGMFNKGSTEMECEQVLDGQICNEDPITIAIEKIIHHPRFERVMGPKNDIALIRLKEEAPYTDFIKPICLPKSNHMHNDLTITGWSKRGNGPNADKKLHMIIPYVDLDICQKAYNGLGLPVNLWNKEICAGREIASNMCQGDIAGILMHKEGESPFVIVGIDSFGPNPCENGIPHVYTHVFSYMDWIKSQLQP